MYKLKINGYNAEFNGITKGTITIDGIMYEWDNSPQDIDYIINYDFSNEENVIAFQNAPVWSGYTGEKAIYKRQDTQQMSWNNDSMKITPTGVRYGLYWTLPAGQATGKVTEEFQLWHDFPGIPNNKQTIGTIFHTYGSKNGEVDRCRLNYVYDPNGPVSTYQWTWRKYTTSSEYTDVLIIGGPGRVDFKIEYDFEDTKEIKIYINGTLYYTDTTSIEACGLTSLSFINNSISNSGFVKSNVTEYVYKVSVN